MGAILLVIAVVICVLVIVDPNGSAVVAQELWHAAREQPALVLFNLAVIFLVLFAVYVVIRLAVVLAFGPRRRRDLATTSTGGAIGVMKQPTSRDVDELERTARHEAAHAITAVVLGMREIAADVHQVRNRNGLVTFEWSGDKPAHEDSYDGLVFGFAGQIIDHRGGHYDHGAMGDMSLQHNRLMAIISTGKPLARHHGPLTVEALIDSARTEAEQLLTTHAAAVDRIAKALVAERELDDAEIRALAVDPAPIGAAAA